MNNSREQQLLRKEQQQRAAAQQVAHSTQVFEEKKQRSVLQGTERQQCPPPQQILDKQQQYHPQQPQQQQQGRVFERRGVPLQVQQHVRHRDEEVRAMTAAAECPASAAAATPRLHPPAAAAGDTRRTENPAAGPAAARPAGLATSGVFTDAAAVSGEAAGAAAGAAASGGGEAAARGGAAAARLAPATAPAAVTAATTPAEAAATAPATSAPAASAPATSAPATSAPAADLLGTARPAGGAAAFREEAAAGEGRGRAAAAGVEGRAAVAARGKGVDMATDASRFHHYLSSSTIVVSQRQRSNPLLQFVRAVPMAVENVVPDFLVGASACVLFLSLRYHQLYPKYIYSRMQSLQHARYARRFLLVHLDLDVPDASLAQVTVLAFHNSYSLLLGSSLVECAGLLQLLKVYENKPPDALLARKQDVSHSARVMEVLSTVSAVTKTDALTLAREFGTMKNLLTASKERLEKCQGIGVKKVKRMTKVFHDPFFAPC